LTVIVRICPYLSVFYDSLYTTIYADYSSVYRSFKLLASRPFHNAQGQVLSTENRATQTKRRRRKAVTTNTVTRPTSRRSQKEKIDPDIESERGTVNIVYDSSR
jgi:hypothetical protein